MSEEYAWQVEFLKSEIDKFRARTQKAERERSIIKIKFNKAYNSRMIFHYILDKVDEFKDEMVGAKNYDVSDALRKIVPEMTEDREWIYDD